jgi:hypothetical protein
VVSEPEVVFVADLEVSEPGVVFVVPFSIVHVSGRQVSVHIHTVFAVSNSVSVVVEGVDIFRHNPLDSFTANLVAHLPIVI